MLISRLRNFYELLKIIFHILFIMILFSGQSQQFGGYPPLSSHSDHKRMLGPAQGDTMDKNIKITLENRDLWSKFHSIGTEMIITKTGR